MKVNFTKGIFFAFFLLGGFFGLQAQIKADDFQKMKRILIDRFVVPAAAKQEFLERMKINRDFIKNQPDFIEDKVYETSEKNGEISFVTIAVWKNAAALRNAKGKVAELYKKQAFDMPAFLEKLNIKIERAIYRELND